MRSGMQRARLTVEADRRVNDGAQLQRPLAEFRFKYLQVPTMAKTDIPEAFSWVLLSIEVHLTIIPAQCLTRNKTSRADSYNYSQEC